MGTTCCAAVRCSTWPIIFFTARNLELRDDQREWDAVAAALGVRPSRLLLIRQVHGAGVAVARRGRTRPWARPEADVIVSDDPSSAIGVRVADCAPILLADRRTRRGGGRPRRLARDACRTPPAPRSAR